MCSNLVQIDIDFVLPVHLSYVLLETYSLTLHSFILKNAFIYPVSSVSFIHPLSFSHYKITRLVSFHHIHIFILPDNLSRRSVTKMKTTLISCLYLIMSAIIFGSALGGRYSTTMNTRITQNNETSSPLPAMVDAPVMKLGLGLVINGAIMAVEVGAHFWNKYRHH